MQCNLMRKNIRCTGRNNKKRRDKKTNHLHYSNYWN